MTTINPLRKKRLKDGNINSRGAFKPPEKTRREKASEKTRNGNGNKH
jgi:hypothetical protein